MKIKGDFVTNSSSCAFILIGWQKEIKDIPEKYSLEYLGEYEPYFHFGGECGAKSDNHVLIGKMIDISDDMDGQQEYSLEDFELDDELLEIKKELQITEKIKIFTGIRMC